MNTKFKVGDLVYLIDVWGTDEIATPDVVILQATVKEVSVGKGGAIYELSTGELRGDADVFATKREAAADAAEFVKEQIVAWQEKLKELENAD